MNELQTISSRHENNSGLFIEKPLISANAITFEFIPSSKFANEYPQAEKQPDFHCLFIKKTLVLKRYLNYIKNICDKNEIHLKNKYTNLRLNKELSNYQKKISRRVFKSIDLHFKQIWDLLINLSDFSEYKITKTFQKYKILYQKELKIYFVNSEFTKQIHYKPLGYPGDYRMINLIYKNTPTSSELFSNLIDSYTLNIPLGYSVRSRTKFIINKIVDLAKYKKMHILSIGCGGAREIFELSSFDINNPIVVSLLDFDKTPLNFVKNNSKSISNKFINLKYYNYNIFELIKNNVVLPKQNMIYSLGLFDYLHDNVSIKLMKYLFSLLQPKGKLIIGNMSESDTARAYMALMGEWFLLYRTKSDLIKLAQKCQFADYSIEEDKTKTQLYLIINKV